MAKRMRETPHKGKKTGSRKKKIAIIVTTVVLALVVAGGTAVYVLLHSNLFGGADMSEYGNSQEGQEKSVNILIVGTDNDTSRPEYADHELTDVIMVVNFNMEDGTAHILQIPRDTYVGDDIPSGKINAVFSRGENKDKHILNLVNYITTQYQLPIDHYITITMQTFIDAVDAIGGIEMNVPYDVTIVDEGLEIKAGQQTLSGQQAQCFVRSRELYAEGDRGDGEDHQTLHQRDHQAGGAVLRQGRDRPDRRRHPELRPEGVQAGPLASRDVHGAGRARLLQGGAVHLLGAQSGVGKSPQREVSPPHRGGGGRGPDLP